MRILVIGGTRFIGRAAVKQLHSAGHELLLFHRGRTQESAREGIKEIIGNRRELATHTAAFKSFAPDVVLEMIALTEEDGQALVATFHRIARRAVVISSMDVYRAYDVLRGVEPEPLMPVPFDEDAPLRTRLYPYRGQSLRAADDPSKWIDDYDKILVERAAQSEPGLPATILRLPMVYGEGDYQHRLSDYFNPMEAGAPEIPLDVVSAQWRTSRGYVENVGAAIVRAVTDERAAGKIYNVADADVFTETEWVKRIGFIAAWKGEVVVRSADELPSELRFEGNARQHLVGDTTRIRHELGYQELFSTDDALRRTIAWERAQAAP